MCDVIDRIERVGNSVGPIIQDIALFGSFVRSEGADHCNDVDVLFILRENSIDEVNRKIIHECNEENVFVERALCSYTSLPDPEGSDNQKPIHVSFAPEYNLLDSKIWKVNEGNIRLI